VPDVLCHKFLRVTSLSASWRRNRRTNLSATASCAKEIRQSDLTFREKARLHLTLGSVARAFLTHHYTAREEFQLVSAYHRAARLAEKHLTSHKAE